MDMLDNFIYLVKLTAMFPVLLSELLKLFLVISRLSEFGDLDKAAFPDNFLPSVLTFFFLLFNSTSAFMVIYIKRDMRPHQYMPEAIKYNGTFQAENMGTDKK